jgi:hypothetical protein
MSKRENRYNPNDPRRPAGPITPGNLPGDLRQVVEDHEPLLREIWAKRKRDDDFIVLMDVGREEVVREDYGQFKAWYSRERIEAALEQRKSGPVYLPYLQPLSLLDMILREGNKPQAEAAKELKGFARVPGAVPLWVVHISGHWTTCWAPPGTRTVVLREDPMKVKGPDGREVIFMPEASQQVELYRPLLQRSWELWKEAVKEGKKELFSGYFGNTLFVVTTSSPEGKVRQLAFTLGDVPSLPPEFRKLFERDYNHPDSKRGIIKVEIDPPPNPEDN